MAIEYTHTITDGDIVVKWADTGITNEIHVANTIATLQVQDLLNACRKAESSIQGTSFDSIAAASGKETLGSGVSVGITVQLLGNWRVYSTKNSGVFTVVGGNLVKPDGSSPFRPNNQITYVNVLSASSTIVTTSGGAGSGDFTETDRSKLTEIYNGTAPLVSKIFDFVIDGTMKFSAVMKKIMSILFGNAVFTSPSANESVIDYKNQAGSTESSHHIDSSGRNVT